MQILLKLCPLPHYSYQNGVIWTWSRQNRCLPNCKEHSTGTLPVVFTKRANFEVYQVDLCSFFCSTIFIGQLTGTIFTVFFLVPGTESFFRSTDPDPEGRRIGIRI